MLSAEAASSQNASSFVNNLFSLARQLKINEPALPRGRNASSEVTSPLQHYVKIYKEVFSAASVDIGERFHSESLSFLAQLEDLILGKSNLSAAEIARLFPDIDATVYGIEMQQLGHLKAQKQLDSSLYPDNICQLFKQDSTLSILLPNISKLLQLYMTLPCTSCEAERSFSTLRRVKTYLRSTMTQQRLNHACVLSVHKEILDQVDLKTLVTDFVSRNSVRQATFLVD